jgi:hypothetical protein
VARCLSPRQPSTEEGEERSCGRPVKVPAANRLITARAVTAGGDREEPKERAVANPVLIAVVISCAHAASRVLDALARRIILRGRRDLVQAAAALPPGTEVREQARTGTWQVKAGQAAVADAGGPSELVPSRVDRPGAVEQLGLDVGEPVPQSCQESQRGEGLVHRRPLAVLVSPSPVHLVVDRPDAVGPQVLRADR